MNFLCLVEIQKMKRIFTLLVLFVALGVSTASAQYDNTRERNETRRYEPGVYQDERGEYRWQTIESRVWIPERRTSGIFGIGGSIIPGHYEVRTTNRIKVYARNDRNDQYGNNQGWKGGKHPHGMPPGQRKKLDKRYDHRWDRDNRDDRRWDRDNRNDNNNHNDDDRD